MVDISLHHQTSFKIFHGGSGTLSSCIPFTVRSLLMCMVQELS